MLELVRSIPRYEYMIDEFTIDDIVVMQDVIRCDQCAEEGFARWR